MQNLSLLAGPMQANKAQDHGNHADLLLNRTYSLSTSSLPKSNSYNGMMDSAMRVLGRRCTVLLLHYVDRLIYSINLPTASIEWPTCQKKHSLQPNSWHMDYVRLLPSAAHYGSSSPKWTYILDKIILFLTTTTICIE